ncbi:MAG: helix-turn-helix domain-containing protein [Roseburia sp.]|nr:helix-turn-helix domain-containing protein [Roseburia sp.]MCM1098982.1 helix-turn-helix domain-containing protein [Ruminococcus flavefaciens]
MRGKETEKRSLLQSKIIYTWILSYATILLIPIFISLSYGIGSFRLIRQQNTVQQHEILSQRASEMDNRFTEVLSVSNSLYLNKSVESLSYVTAGSMRGNHHMSVHLLQEDISISAAANHLLTDIYVYFPNIKTVVGAKTIYTTDLVPYMTSVNRLDETLMKEVQEALDEGRTLYLFRHPDTGTLMLAQRVRSSSHTGQITAIGVYFLNQEVLADYIATDLENVNIVLADARQFLFYIPSMEEGLLAEDGRILSRAMAAQDLPEEYRTKDRKRYVLDCLPSGIGGLYYLSLTGRDSYNGKVSSMLAFFILTMVCSIFLGIFFTLYYVKKNYAPLREILEHLDPVPDRRRVNEYSIILNSIVSSTSEIARQRELLRNHYLQKVLTGEIKDEDNAVFAVGPSGEAGSYYIALIRIVEEHTADQKLYFFIVENVLRELMAEQGCDTTFCGFPGYIAAVIYCGGKTERERIEEELKTLAEFCRKNYSVALHIGVSNRWEGREALANAFAQALEALEYVRFYENGFLCFFSSVPVMDKLSSLDLKSPGDMTALVMNGNAEEVELYFDTLQKQFYSQSLTVVEGKNMLYYYYQLLLSLRLTVCRKYISGYPDAIDRIDSGFLQLSVREAAELTRRIFAELQDFIVKQRSGQVQLLTAQVCHYIDNNYFDMNLNLNTIADHFHITPAYLSKKFKEEREDGIIDYLYTVRIRHSLELLKKEELKIGEIAMIVGFPRSNAFIRIFKQYMGVSPGRYRESRYHAEEDDSGDSDRSIERK